MQLSNGKWYCSQLGGHVPRVGLHVRPEENEHRSNEHEDFAHRTANESAEKSRKNDRGNWTMTKTPVHLTRLIHYSLSIIPLGDV